jgi:3-dehydroquinate dehydratase
MEGNNSIIKDLEDIVAILHEHNNLLRSYKELLDEFKTENRMRNSVIELRLDRLESRQDDHVHKGYQQRATRKLYNNEQ